MTQQALRWHTVPFPAVGKSGEPLDRPGVGFGRRDLVGAWTGKALGINGIGDLFRDSGRVWAYCTEKWLKFQDRPDAHHTQRDCLPWWKTVQRGFNGGQGATPAVRAKAVEWDRKQLMAQAVGVIGTLAALEATERHGIAPTGEEILESFEDIVQETKEIGCGSQDLPEVVRSKVAQFQRTRAAHEAAVRNRNAQEQEENRQ